MDNNSKVIIEYGTDNLKDILFNILAEYMGEEENAK